MIDEHRDPRTGELYNAYRADRAQAALNAYIDFTGDSPDESHFRDLLSDLRHLAARDGAGDGFLLSRDEPLTFDEANELAASNYVAEVEIEEADDA